jgi:hypothetical protein
MPKPWENGSTERTNLLIAWIQSSDILVSSQKLMFWLELEIRENLTLEVDATSTARHSRLAFQQSCCKQPVLLLAPAFHSLLRMPGMICVGSSVVLLLSAVPSVWAHTQDQYTTSSDEFTLAKILCAFSNGNEVDMNVSPLPLVAPRRPAARLLDPASHFPEPQPQPLHFPPPHPSLVQPCIGTFITPPFQKAVASLKPFFRPPW